MNKDLKKYGFLALAAGALLLLFKNNYTKKIVNFAKKWVGVKTDKGNVKFTNAEMERLMKQIGWSKYDQWCMDFVKMVYYNAYKGNPEMQKIIQDTFNYSSQLSYEAVNNGKNLPFEVSTSAAVGDILIFQRKSNKTQGHAGIITKVKDGKYVETIEGNTGSNQGNGHWVMNKTRPYTIGSSIGSGLYVRGIIHRK